MAQEEPGCAVKISSKNSLYPPHSLVPVLTMNEKRKKRTTGGVSRACSSPLGSPFKHGNYRKQQRRGEEEATLLIVENNRGTSGIGRNEQHGTERTEQQQQRRFICDRKGKRVHGLGHPCVVFRAVRGVELAARYLVTEVGAVFAHEQY